MNIGYRQIVDHSDLALKILNEQLEMIWHLLLNPRESAGGGNNG